MRWKMLTSTLLWLIVSLCWIVLWSVQDKEWWIGEGGIKNICDLMRSVENDDTRDVGIFISLPIFLPIVYAIITKKRNWFFWLVATLISGYWLWQFFIRYQLCI